MGKTIIIIEHLDGKVSRASLEALRGAQELTATLNHSLAAVMLGHSQAPEDLSAIQMDELILVPSEEMEDYSPEYYTAAMKAVAEREKPDLLLAAHTYQARDWLPCLASSLGRPLISDCIGYRVDGSNLIWTRHVFQGKINADVVPTAGLVLVAFQSGTFKADELAKGSPAVRTLEVDLSGVTSRVHPGERFKESKGTVDLSRAERVVSVGRGIAKEENLKLIQDLAEVLGAEIGSSRPVVDYGWLPHDHQVGSSGQTVSAKLYLAVGISGAIQHQVGMKNSGCIVAINKDSNAPIFEVADYGIVADLMEIVPVLTETLRARPG